MKQILKLTLIFLLLIFSCEKLTYSPEKKNYVPIQQNIINDVSITFGNQNEPIGLFGTMNLNYNLHLGSKEFYKIEFYLDSVNIGSTQDENNYTIYTSGFNDGAYTLRFDIWVYSGTGSLADILESEFAILSKDVQVIIDNTPPDPITNITFDIYQGQLRLSWPKYNRSNFQEYIVYMNDNEYKRITTKDQNFAINESYIGSFIHTYRVDVKGANTIVRGAEFSYSDSLPQLTELYLVNENRPHLKWTRCKYYGSFNSYKIYRKILGDFELIRTLNNVNDTTFTDLPINFGSKIEYKIYTHPSFGIPLISNTEEIWLGQSLPLLSNFTKIFYNQYFNSFYIGGMNWINRVDADSFNTIAQANFAYFDMSNHGPRIFANLIPGNQANNNEFFELDPASLNIIHTHDTQTYLNKKSLISNLHFLHPNRIIYMGFLYVSPTVFGDKDFVLNIDTGDSVTSIQSNWGPPHIYYRSTSGNYVLISNNGYKLYDLRNNFFREVYTVPNYHAFCFNGYLDEFIYIENGLLSIRYCNNGTLKTEFPIISDLRDPTIDLVTGYCGGKSVSDNKYYIYDITSGTLLKEISLSTTSIDLKLENSVLFSDAGYYLPLLFN